MVRSGRLKNAQRGGVYCGGRKEELQRQGKMEIGGDYSE